MARKYLGLFLGFALVLSGVACVAPSDNAMVVPVDSNEARELISILEDMHTMYDQSMRSGGDVSQFDQILMDSPDYPVNDEAQQMVEKVYGADAPKKAGYLTYMKAIHLAYGKGIEAYKLMKAAAVAENRDLTQEEWAAIKTAGYGTIPPSNYVAEQTGMLPSGGTTYEKIVIDGNQAWVQFDNGAALDEAVFLQVDGRWFVIDIKAIYTHY